MTKKILSVNRNCQVNNDPFKFIQVSINKKIKKKLLDNMNLFQILNSIHRCYFLGMIELEEEIIINYLEEEYRLLYEIASAMEKSFSSSS